jgi:H+/Cl- antiporter ClcA
VFTGYARFVAAWLAHVASYASGILGGIVLAVLTYRRRWPVR